MPVVLLTWRPMVRNTLRGFAGVRLGRSLVLHDIVLHHKGGRSWCGMPGKLQADATGIVRRDAAGKQMYSPVVEWSDKTAAARFSDAVIAAVEAAYPGALTGENVP